MFFPLYFSFSSFFTITFFLYARLLLRDIKDVPAAEPRVPATKWIKNKMFPLHLFKQSIAAMRLGGKVKTAICGARSHEVELLFIPPSNTPTPNHDHYLHSGQRKKNPNIKPAEWHGGHALSISRHTCLLPPGIDPPPSADLWPQLCVMELPVGDGGTWSRSRKCTLHVCTAGQSMDGLMCWSVDWSSWSHLKTPLLRGQPYLFHQLDWWLAGSFFLVDKRVYIPSSAVAWCCQNRC